MSRKNKTLKDDKNTGTDFSNFLNNGSKNKKEADFQLPFVIVAGRDEFSNFLAGNFEQILESYALINKSK